MPAKLLPREHSVFQSLADVRERPLPYDVDLTDQRSKYGATLLRRSEDQKQQQEAYENSQTEKDLAAKRRRAEERARIEEMEVRRPRGHRVDDVDADETSLCSERESVKLNSAHKKRPRFSEFRKSRPARGLSRPVKQRRRKKCASLRLLDLVGSARSKRPRSAAGRRARRNQDESPRRRRRMRVPRVKGWRWTSTRKKPRRRMRSVTLRGRGRE
jgi:RNA polymerase-associated protein CTR9